MTKETFYTETKGDIVRVQKQKSPQHVCGLTEEEVDIIAKSFFPSKKKGVSVFRSFFQRVR